MKRHVSLAWVIGVCLPGAACADERRSFPPPVTSMARDTLSIHHEFMLIITALFVVVFAIMIHSMIRHHKSTSAAPAKCSGPGGLPQWLWVLVPFAILLGVDFALLGIPR